MKEAHYKAILAAYLSHRLPVAEYITAFMDQWKRDRDLTWDQPLGEESPRQEVFHALMNRLFTSCDCYTDQPESAWEIGEEELRQEVQRFWHRLWEA